MEATKNRIRKFKKFWQVLNKDGNTIFQSVSRQEAEFFDKNTAMYLYGMKDPMREHAYQRKAYRDKRHFVMN